MVFALVPDMHWHEICTRAQYVVVRETPLRSICVCARHVPARNMHRRRYKAARRCADVGEPAFVPKCTGCHRPSAAIIAWRRAVMALVYVELLSRDVNNTFIMEICFSAQYVPLRGCGFFQHMCIL